MTIRDEAIMILAICATNLFTHIRYVVAQCDFRIKSQRLAFEALIRVQDANMDLPIRIEYAEAECLLREGWTP